MADLTRVLQIIAAVCNNNDGLNLEMMLQGVIFL